MIKLKFIENNINSLIICDTNVWYKISEDKYKKPNNILLTATALSLEEVATSKMIISNIEYFQKVIKALKENNDSILSLNPIEYVLNNNGVNIKENPLKTQDILTWLTNIALIDKDYILEKKSEIEDYISNAPFRNLIKDMTSEISQEAERIRKINENNLDRYQVSNKKLVVKIFDSFAIKNNYTIDWSKFDWSQISFFMNTLDCFFNQLENREGKKMDSNDFVDLFNLLYVRNQDKYLTFDNKGVFKSMTTEDKAKYLLTT